MSTPSSSKSRKRPLKTPKNETSDHDSGTEYADNSDEEDEDEFYGEEGIPEQPLPSSRLLEMLEEQNGGNNDDDPDAPSTSKKRRVAGLDPLVKLLEEDTKIDRNFSSTHDTAFLAYDEEHWNPLSLYRLPSDIALQRIHKSGGEGVGRNEVGNDLQMDTTTKAGNRRVSAFIVNVCNDKKEQIGQYQKMDGKVRSIRYFWKANNTPEKFQQLFDDFQKFAGIPCPFKLAQVIKFPNCNLNTLRISDVSLRRLNDLMEMLSHTPVIVTINRVSKYIEEKEKLAGYQYSIDKKSLLKCMKALENEGLLHIYETTVLCDGAQNKIQCICHRDVTSVDEPIVKEYIESTIDQYHKEGRVFPHGQLRYSVKKRGDLPSNNKEAMKISTDRVLKSFDPNVPMTVDNRFNIFRAMTSRATVMKHEAEDCANTLEETVVAEADDDKKPDIKPPLMPPEDPMDITMDTAMFDDDCVPLPPIDKKRVVKLNTSMANLYGYQSKALRFGILHEMAYQFVYGHAVETRPTFYEKFPLGTPLAMWPFNPDPHIYVDQEDPTRFMPPLPPFQGLQRGWFMLQDFITALPLSVFVLVAYVPKNVDNGILDDYLRHPIRRHTVIGDLPNELRIPLIRDKKLYRQIEHQLLCLSAMGLMCAGENPDPKRFVTAASAMFFVTRRGELYDTSTSARGYATISDPVDFYQRYVHGFDSLQKVQRYWQHLRAIVQSTPLSFRVDMAHSEASLQRHKKYSQGLLDKSKVTKLPGEDLSTIEPMEPRDGCAGFDSALFLHLRRHWDLNPRPSVYVSWYIVRFRHSAELAQDFINQRVHNLQQDWNSFVKSMMPSDLDLTKNKRAMASTTTIYPSTRASITIEPKSKTRLQSTKKSQEWRKKKRPLDSVDLVSQESRVHMRCRFNAREKDMLILIRAVGFFLNPVYRFWLDPTVLRDIMHDYMPESRSKTVQSLMAAGVREMVRPNRLAYLQRIVRNLSTFPEMRQLRYQLASQPLVSPQDKTLFFKNAFDLANKLLFMDTQSMPHTSTDDKVFQKFLKEGEFALAPEQTHSNPMPLRSRAPVSLPHIHHSVAVNVLMGILIHCHEGMVSERILSQLNATVIHNALQVLRSDGLVSRTRTLDASLMVVTKNQAVLSVYFRHFFAHRFHPDIIEQTNLILRSFPLVVDNERELFLYSGDHVGLIIAASNAFYSQNDLDVEVDQEILNIFEEASTEQQQSTKQIRYLENADLHLEKLSVTHILNSSYTSVVKVEDLAEMLDKSQDKDEIESATPSVMILSFPTVSLRKPMNKVYTAIKEAGALGIKLDDIVSQTQLRKETVQELIQHLWDGNCIIECGVDAIRWIATEFREAWCVNVYDRIVYPKPWTLPTGGICLPTVRWMAESCLFTIVANAGITMKDLHFRYEFALQPSAVTELVHLLVKAECVELKEEEFLNMELASPFDDDIPMTTCTYLLPTVDCAERFGRIFSDVSLLPSMQSITRPDDEYVDMDPHDSSLLVLPSDADQKGVHLMETEETMDDSALGLL